MIAFQPNSKGPMRYVHTFERKVGGAELNLLIGCARLGLETGFLSRFGDDEFGRHILNFVRGEGIDISAVELVSGYPTSVYFKEVFEGGVGQSFFYRDRSPTEVITEETVSEDFIKNTRILHITGVFASIHPKNVGILKRAITLAKKHDVKISFDPNIRLRMWSKEEARDGLLQLLPYVDI